MQYISLEITPILSRCPDLASSKRGMSAIVDDVSQRLDQSKVENKLSAAVRDSPDSAITTRPFDAEVCSIISKIFDYGSAQSPRAPHLPKRASTSVGFGLSMSRLKRFGSPSGIEQSSCLSSQSTVCSLVA